MMARLNSPLLALLIAVPLVLTSACTDDRAITVNDGNPLRENQGQPDDLTVEAKLLHVEPECDPQSTVCARSVRVGDRTQLKVQLLNPENEPIENAFINFDLDLIERAQGSTLSAMRAVTNRNGIATVDFATADDNPAANMGTAQVTASVHLEDDEAINSLEFTLGISTKAGGAYIINYTHNGESRPEQVITRTFTPGVTCAEIEDKYLTDGSPPPALLQLPHAVVHPNGDISPVIHPQVPNGDSFTVLGIARREIGSEEVDVAYGCSDNNPAVENGMDVILEIPLIDHLPHIGKRYSIDHAFNLTDALPPAVQNIVELIELLATNPAKFILGDKENNRAGLIDLLTGLDFIPQNIKDFIESFRDGIFYGVALDFLNEALENVLPSWVKTGMVGAADITDMLQRFSVRGRMHFEEQPDIDLSGDQVVGILYEENNRQVWDSIIFRWSQGCEGQPASCSNVPVNATGYTGDSAVIEGNFAARLQGSNKLRIERHSLTLHYGALLLAAIEKVVLPRVFDNPDVDSLDKMASQLINCPDLVSKLVEADGNFRSTLETLCDQLVNNATDALRNYITETLVADGADHFQLETPAENDCTLYQPTNYVGNTWPGHPRPYVEKLGMNETGKECNWKTYIRFSADSSPRVVGGTFSGTLAR